MYEALWQMNFMNGRLINCPTLVFGAIM